MNNSQLPLPQEAEVDRLPFLRQHEGQLVKIIETIGRIAASDDWRTLKDNVFDRLLESIERKMRLESEKKEIDTHELNRLQGQLSWAKKYSDFEKLSLAFRQELLTTRETIKQHAKE